MANIRSRRSFIAGMAMAVGSTALAGNLSTTLASEKKNKGAQRLSLKKLREWEAMRYGMFIHFGMSTFTGNELPDGTAPASVYAPDNPDADQWMAVAKEAGIKYAVLTTKHVAGHCLWPSKHTNYTVANSSNTTDVVGAFVTACRKYGIKPGFYYCSWDNHHTFGSQTPSVVKWNTAMNSFPKKPGETAPFTTSMYQNFQTAQITELLTQYGDIAEMWVDIPGVLGRGYRTYLYQYIAKLQPNCVIMMNSGISSGENYNVDYAWPSDLIAIERNLPQDGGHKKWREIEGETYYIPGEVCDPIGKDWFYVEGDKPRADDVLLNQYLSVTQRGANLLLDVPPDKSGVIPDMHVKALIDLKKNAGIL